MKKFLRTPKRKSPALALTVAFTFALTLTLGFALSVSQDGSIAFPKAACADNCETSPVWIDGQMKVCQRCCNEAGACTMFCA